MSPYKGANIKYLMVDISFKLKKFVLIKIDMYVKKEVPECL